MSALSNIITMQVIDKLRKKNIANGKRKSYEYTTEQFECSGDGYTGVFVIFSVIFAVITVIAVISFFTGGEDAGVAVYFFGVVTVLTIFASWASAHQRLIVDGNEATYVNVWGMKCHFQLTDVTQCLTTEQFLRLYIGNRKVATLDKDMYGLAFLEARCKEAGIQWRNKSGRSINKFTLVWHATRTIAWIFIWTIVGITALVIPVSISSRGFTVDAFVFIIEIELLMAAFFFGAVALMMLFFAIGLKEVNSIERALGLSFREEMARRGATGREFQDEEWFVESVPGKIEVLNRRFIKKWHGIKEVRTSGSSLYHVEFTDINGKRHKIGGHYKEHADKMCRWYLNRESK